MTKHDDFTIEELDPDNQPLIEDLQQLYHTYDEDTLSVARVRNRLSGEAGRADGAKNADYLFARDRQRVRFVRNERGRTWQRNVSTLVAVLVAALLIGSLLLLVTHTHQGSTTASGVSVTPTPNVVQISVPNLGGDSFQKAQSTVTTDGLTLQVPDGVTTGIVISQDPPPDALAPRGSAIRVKFGPATTQTVIVPVGLVGNSLSAVEQILTSAGIPYITRPDGTDPKKQPNTVSRVDPPSGTSIPKGQEVILYVVNLINGTPTPLPSPTVTTLTPTPVPYPTGTPTPAPFPSPTPTPVP